MSTCSAAPSSQHTFPVKVHGLGVPITADLEVAVKPDETIENVISRYLTDVLGNRKPYLTVTMIQATTNGGAQIQPGSTMDNYKDVRHIQLYSEEDENIDKAVRWLITSCRDKSPDFITKVGKRVTDKLEQLGRVFDAVDEQPDESDNEAD